MPSSPLCFNPRTHEECDSFSASVRKPWTCFNPRTHEECDWSCQVRRSQLGVSIHALTRSATEFRKMSKADQAEFQSTHSRGVRRRVRGYRGMERRFQSTHSRGVRHRCRQNNGDHHEFQSTHSRGVRLGIECLQRKRTLFQSTHSRGVRQPPRRMIRWTVGFNPRTHEECDLGWAIGGYNISRFQSTHSRGVRLSRRSPRRCISRVSIHALTRSATIPPIASMWRAQKFQSTHSRGVRQLRSMIL